MIIALQHEDLGGTMLAQKFNSLSEFIQTNFNPIVDEKGNILIEGEIVGPSYALIEENPRGFTKEEAIKDFCKSNSAKNYASRHNWSIYKVDRKLS